MNTSSNIITIGGIISAGIFGVSNEDIGKSEWYVWIPYVVFLGVIAFFGSFFVEAIQDKISDIKKKAKTKHKWHGIQL